MPRSLYLVRERERKKERKKERKRESSSPPVIVMHRMHLLHNGPGEQQRSVEAETFRVSMYVSRRMAALTTMYVSMYVVG